MFDSLIFLIGLSVIRRSLAQTRVNSKVDRMMENSSPVRGNDMSAIRFIDIQEQHLAEVQAIYNHYVENTTITFTTEPLTLDETREMVINADSRFKSFLIIEDETVYGYVLLTQFKKRQAYNKTAELTIYLKPDCMGRGLGQTALEFIENEAKSQGFHALLAVICTENERSERLFAKNAYRKNAHFEQIGYKFDRYLDVSCYQKLI